MAIKITRILFAVVTIIGIYLIVKIIYIDTNKKYGFLNTDQIPTEVFTISPAKDTVLTGEKGTKLLIKQYCFIDNAGNIVKDSVQIKLKEVLSKPDIILAGLTTTSGSKLLETGGMLFLEAFSNHTKLQVLDSKPIIAVVPTRKKKDGMQLFKGKKNDDGLDWIKPEDILNQPFNVVSAYGFIPDGMTEQEALNSGFIKRDTVTVYSGYATTNLLEQVENTESLDSYDTSLSKYWDDTYYILKMTGFGWCNIDRFIKESETQPVNFEAFINHKEQYDATDTYLIFSDMEIYLSGMELTDGRIIFGKTQDSNVDLPLDEKISLLSFGYKNKKLYSELIETTIRESQKIDVNLKKTTKEEIENIISKKFNDNL